MTRIIEIRTGARLHFGLFGTRSEQGRLGGIGMMIDRPGYTLRGRSAREDVVSGDDAHAVERVRAMLWQLAKLRRVQAARHGGEPPAVAIDVHESIPRHHGYGSGTQLSFAVGELLTALRIVTVDDPSGTFGRGRRSVVGSLGFQFGGFVVDYGESAPERCERRIEMAHVSDQWRFVVIDPRSGDSYSGSSESEAFRTLAPMPSSTRDDLCRLTGETILPALRDRNFHAFAAGVASFNHIAGSHFAPVQGGVYAHPRIRQLARTLADSDWPHLAQSSWGPAAVVFCENHDSAIDLMAFLTQYVPPDAAHMFVAAPKNEGAWPAVIDA